MHSEGKPRSFNFVNSKGIVRSIINEEDDQILEISSLDSSEPSSGLNFSTFRSEDFPSFLSHSGRMSPSKSIKLCKVETRDTVTCIRELNFRNSSKLVHAALSCDSKRLPIGKCCGTKQLNFRVDG